MDHAIAIHQLHKPLDGREDGGLEKVCVILVVFLLARHCLTLSGKLFRRYFPEWLDAQRPPLCKRLI